MWMVARRGGVTFGGALLASWPRVPVFHCYGRYDRETERQFTECNRTIPACATYLSLDHLVKFARPCVYCFGRNPTTGTGRVPAEYRR